MTALVPALDLRPAHEKLADPSALPHNIEAEQALLGCLLYDNEAVGRCEGLEGHHFFEPFHGRLLNAITELVAQGSLAEPIIIASRFAEDPAFHELGGMRYLADLVDRAPPAANARDYAREVIDVAERRELMRICSHGMAVARDPSMTGRQHIEAVEGALYALAENQKAETGFVPFADALDGAVEMAAAAYAKDGSVSGLSTGLTDLDQRLGGLHPSDLIILGGRPSMGKTSLCTNIAFHVARQYTYETLDDGSRRTLAGGQVAFFSLEMSKEQLALRILAEVSGVSGDRLRKGTFDYNEFARVREAARAIRSAPLHIDATGAISIAKLAARARRLKRMKGGLDLIVVDYLQLASPATTGGQRNRVQDITEITTGLKALAKDLGVPVIALSQLSREVEKREDKRPQLSDLRESGSIEQDADVVMFVYREEYYLSRTEPKEATEEHLAWLTKMDEVRGKAEVIIGKQRHGPIGTVKLAFNEDLTKFGNLAREGFIGGRDPTGGN